MISTILLVSTAWSAKRVVFAGGPAGGTFQIVANSVTVYDGLKEAGYTVRAQASGGSIENLRTVNRGRVDFGVVFSGHIYQGRNGLLKNDKRKYNNVYAVAAVYGSPAQLVVKKGSGIKSLKDLAGKRVGVGNAGSGAFANCQLFFTHMGIWDKIDRSAIGYNEAAQAMGNNQLDAFWLFTAFPSGAVIMAAQNNDIEMVDLYKEANDSGFLKKYPYFEKVVIPAGTYNGVDVDTDSFQDAAVWVASKKVPANVVYDILKSVYSDEGLKFMHNQVSTFKSMSIQSGAKGVITPFHPGAEKFWKEKGMM